MPRFLFITMLAIVAGILLWLNIDPSPPLAQAQQQPMSPVVGSESEKDPESKAYSSHSSQLPATTDMARQLTTLRGRALQQQLELFWRNCHNEQNCAHQLAELQASLSESYYDLVANYPQLHQQWQQVLGSLELGQFATLNERVSELKHQAEILWGQQASSILADEYALYDFSLDAQTLASSGAGDYVIQFQQLTERWQDSQEALGFNNDIAKFEKAVSLIPSHYTPTQREQVVEQLSSIYLTPSQATSILARQQQVESQAKQVSDYQTQLSQLKSTLSSQRTTIYAGMNDAQWQEYYQQQVEAFRSDFFDNF